MRKNEHECGIGNDDYIWDGQDRYSGCGICVKKERECGVKQFSFEAVQNTHRARVLSSQKIISLRTRIVNLDKHCFSNCQTDQVSDKIKIK